MRSYLVIAAVALGAASARAAPPAEPAPPMAGRAPEGSTRLQSLTPIELMYRPLDRERQNVGANGRKNATAAEQTAGMIGWQPALSGWGRLR
jgi:hypothetical protein